MYKVIAKLGVFLLISPGVHSQNDYIQYYNLMNRVKQHVENKRNDSATILIKQAFKLVDYVPVEQLKLGKRVARKQKDAELLSYCQQAIKISGDDINAKLRAQLDSIGKEDQRVRRRKYIRAKEYYGKCLYNVSFNCNEKKRIKSKRLMQEWDRVDSSNVEFIKKVISENGFPSEKAVGKETNDMVAIVLLHYDKDTANHIMGEILFAALKEGAIKPKMYAWIIDRHLMNAGNGQKYYAIPTPWINMTEEKRQEYNKNRYLIGLMSLDEIKIKVRKNSVKVSF